MSGLVVTLALLVAQADVAVSHRKVTTADGAALALHRFLPPGGGVLQPPVLLVADVGFGRPLYDFKQRGLARWLASRGRAVYVAELRGQGASSSGHSLRSVVHLDLPAVAAAIAQDRASEARSAPACRGQACSQLSSTGSDRTVADRRVDLIAHGYLGALALAAAGHELPVRRVVALQTPVLVESPTELVEAFLSGGGRFSSLSSSPEGFEIFSQLFSMGAEVDDGALRGLASSTRDLSRGTSAELLAWLHAGDLPLDDGTTVLGRLREYRAPTLLLLALADGFVPAESCTPLRELSKAPVQVRLFSRFMDGDDFSHASLLVGELAPRVVFPAVQLFLEAAP